MPKVILKYNFKCIYLEELIYTKLTVWIFTVYNKKCEFNMRLTIYFSLQSL